MERTKGKENRFPIFQKRFRELQEEMSNTEFADFLGMSRQTVGFYLNGNRIPDILGLEQIARKCNVSADWLIGISNAKSLDIDCKNICRYTGLSEESVIKLNKASMQKDGPNIISMFFDRLLSGAIFRFQRDAIHYAAIVIQGGEKRKRPGAEKRSKDQPPELDSILNQVKVHGQIVEILADDAMRVYRDSATRRIEGISRVVIDDYTEKLIEYINMAEK